MRIATSINGLSLRALAAGDADELFRLVQDNAAHLTAHGDYTDLIESTPDIIRRELAEPMPSPLRFGLVLHGKLVGRLDLVPVDPPRYGLGYWLAQNAVGNGYATAAVRAATAYARVQLEATDIFAGVTHGNTKSVAVLERSGFRESVDFERYTRFHLPLVKPAER